MKQRDIVFSLIILVFCLVASGCGNKQPDAENPKPNITENHTYYNITGATANDLRRQMDILGPSDEFRDQHDAYTEWYVDWSYPNLVTSDGCATGPISVTVTITQTFPKWEPPPETSPNLISEWNAYIEALQLHESGHSEIGIEAGEEILRSLSNLPPYPTCGELEQIADAKGQSILDEFHRKEVEYDRTTQHGGTQNAQFP